MFELIKLAGTLIFSAMHNIVNLRKTKVVQRNNISSIKDSRWPQPLFNILDCIQDHHKTS